MSKLEELRKMIIAILQYPEIREAVIELTDTIKKMSTDIEYLRKNIEEINNISQKITDIEKKLIKIETLCDKGNLLEANNYNINEYALDNLYDNPEFNKFLNNKVSELIKEKIYEICPYYNRYSSSDDDYLYR